MHWYIYQNLIVLRCHQRNIKLFEIMTNFIIIDKINVSRYISAVGFCIASLTQLPHSGHIDMGYQCLNVLI